MTFNPLAGFTVASLLQFLPETPSVVELGNQTFTVTDDILEKIIAQDRASKTIDIEVLSSFIGKSIEEKHPFTELFYKALGFKSYAAIDVNSKYGSLMIDLNRDVRADYKFYETFDFVTNNGTGEHIFNQYAVLKNIHDLTNVGGIMLHIMPFVNWINHGFYNFHPKLYTDLAKANSYKVLKLSLANRWGFEIEIDTADVSPTQSEPVPQPIQPTFLNPIINYVKHLGIVQPLKPMIKAIKEQRDNRPKISKISLSDALVKVMPGSGNSPLTVALEAVMKDEQIKTESSFPVLGNVMVVAALQKVIDQPFLIPIEGRYVDDIESVEIRDMYKVQTETVV